MAKKVKKIDAWRRHTNRYGVPTVAVAKMLLKEEESVAAINRLGLVDASQVEGSDFFDRNREALKKGLELANEMAKR